MLLIAILALAYIVADKHRKLERFDDIADMESYREQCRNESEKATVERNEAQREKDKAVTTTESLKAQVKQYQKVVKDFKSAADLQRYIKQMSSFASGCRTLGELHAKIEHQTHLADQLVEDTRALGYALECAKAAGDINAQIVQKRRELDQLGKQVFSVEEVKELQEFGFYRRKYEFDSSERYKQQLDKVRDDLKQMIKDKVAATCDTEWTVEGSKSKGRKMVNNKIKLLLRAFNGESDAAIAKVTYSNATSMEGRIERSFNQINKMGEVNQVSISRSYLVLKLRELFLAHEYKIQKQEEKEEQKRIKQLMQEEAKVEREMKKAQQDAEQEEEAKKSALETARAELKAQEGVQTEKLSRLVAKLELELQEAIDRKAKAIARAQLTKSGHVYILSNVGSFGEGIYKIGMTRRLEPLERVKELGSASVPFLFDVHAMIYSENAPKLETQLHHHFAERRVNIVNMRKEFFRITLDEIRNAVSEYFGEVTFVVEHEAEEYRQTVARLAEDTTESSSANAITELAAS